MLVINAIAAAQNQGLSKKTSVTIGNFDGCHIGHQLLVRSAREFGLKHQASPVALSFAPRPEAFFRGLEAEDSLFNPWQKRRAFAELGLDALIEQTFDAEFARIDALTFAKDYLIRSLGARAICVGQNFRFGRGRHGTAAWLQQQGDELGLDVHVCAPATDEQGVVSSSRIRQALMAGDVDHAQAQLGRPYLLEGRVVSGDRLGRTLNFPTANLAPNQQLIPKPGVYAVRALCYPQHAAETAPPIMQVPKTCWIAACNIGYRPTLGQAAPKLRIEVHVLGQSLGEDALYDLNMAIYFDKRLRDEQKFGSLDELRHQIARDCAMAQDFYQAMTSRP